MLQWRILNILLDLTIERHPLFENRCTSDEWLFSSSRSYDRDRYCLSLKYLLTVSHIYVSCRLWRHPWARIHSVINCVTCLVTSTCWFCIIGVVNDVMIFKQQSLELSLQNFVTIHHRRHYCKYVELFNSIMWTWIFFFFFFFSCDDLWSWNDTFTSSDDDYACIVKDIKESRTEKLTVVVQQREIVQLSTHWRGKKIQSRKLSVTYRG